MRLSSNNMNQLVNLPQLKMSWGKFIGTVGLFGAYPDCSRKRKNVNQSMVGRKRQILRLPLNLTPLL